MKATDFDKKFDEDKEDIIEDLDLASALRKGTSERLLEIGRRAASRGIRDPQTRSRTTATTDCRDDDDRCFSADR